MLVRVIYLLALRNDICGALRAKTGSADPAAVARARLPFDAHVVLTLDTLTHWGEDSFDEASGWPPMPVQAFGGFSVKNDTAELDRVVENVLNMTSGKLGWTKLRRGTECIHASPTSGISKMDWSAVSGIFHRKYRSLQDLLQHTKCKEDVGKSLAIMAAHMRLMQAIRDHRFDGSNQSDWVLIQEDDVEMCPGWLERLNAELALAPQDADVLKLSWFGHWMQKDTMPIPGSGEASPFLNATDSRRGLKWFWRSMRSALSPQAHKDEATRVSPFYMGTQAYMVRKASMDKVIKAIKQSDINDMDVLLSGVGNVYAWRRQLAVEKPGEGETYYQAGKCNEEPAVYMAR